MNILKFLQILLRKEKVDILLTHYTDPRTYPTEIYTINILKNKGYKVKEICINVKNVGSSDDTTFIFIGKRDRRFYYLYNYPLFFLFIFFYTLIKRPKVIISYETFAFLPSFIVARFFNIPIIYHIHDIFDKKGLGICGKFIHSFERCFLRYVNIFSMPVKERIEYYSNFIKLPKKIYVIMNALSIKEDFTGESLIHNLLKDKRSIKKWIVRTGGLGDDQCIKELIISLKYLPEDIGLFISGNVKVDFKKELLRLIMENKLNKRVVISDILPRKEVLKFLKDAFIGISLYKPIDIVCIYPAPLKLAEYIAAGVPAIVNDSEYFRELNKKVGSFLFADTYSPESIAKAIMKIYKDKKLEKKLRNNAKNAYRKFYNFEYQFEPVLKEIEEWVKR